ncbi:MAG: hypothetical protein IZT60_00505 [Gammaproteobacteria bacterium]|nr:hypothetical protein [Gammaproteobacteria bacterium]
MYQTNKQRFVLIILLFSALALASCVSTHHPGGLSNKWRIEVSEGAKSDGIMLFRVTPNDQPAIDVRVHINDGLRENMVAKAIKNAFREQLPKGYHVERDDGEDVLVKRRWGTPRFGLDLVSSDVKAVRIDLEKE